eukprot:5976997-Prymnesium_polylepis.1
MRGLIGSRCVRLARGQALLERMFALFAASAAQHPAAGAKKMGWRGFFGFGDLEWEWWGGGKINVGCGESCMGRCGMWRCGLGWGDNYGGWNEGWGVVNLVGRDPSGTWKFDLKSLPERTHAVCSTHAALSVLSVLLPPH